MRFLPRWGLLATCCLCFLLSAFNAVAQPASLSKAATNTVVNHQLSFPDLATQYVHVQSRFPAEGAETYLLLPRWTPGSYLIHNFDSDVDGLKVTDEAGRQLVVQKQSADRWLVRSNDSAFVQVRYRVHAARLNVSQSWLSSQYGLLNFTSVLMYTSGSRGLAQWLVVEPPTALPLALSPLPALELPNTWLASDYDELVDSPLILTDQAPRRFSVDGRAYVLAQAGDARHWDHVKAVEDIETLIAEQNDFWGSVPLQRDYWIFNVLSEYGGGLEHDHSTVLMAGRRQMLNRKDYIDWLSLVSHEYFHVWNVRRMRPLGLEEYDYQQPQYTSSLWFVEGLTSYYDDLFLSRAKLITPVEYLERIAAHIHALEMTPGRLGISLEQASRDAWTRHYQPDANAINSQISYYIKGAVVALVLDIYLRDESRGRLSLDDVMRDMYETWEQEPYPEPAFFESLERLAGTEARQWVEPMIKGTAEPDVDQALDWLGLVVERQPGKVLVEAAGGSMGAGFGLNFSAEGQQLIVESVVEGLAGAAAGIIPGDEVLAVDEQRVTADNFEKLRLRLRPDQQLYVLVARQGQVLNLPLRTSEPRSMRYEIRSRANFGTRQLKRLRRWLGQPVNQG